MSEMRSDAAMLAQHTIAIIGGGLSGSLVAAHLLRHAIAPLQIKLVERRPLLGRGVAYSTSLDCHFLNVSVGKMSAFADDPQHFLRWLEGVGEFEASSFVPRQLYGQYIQTVLEAAEASALAEVRLERLTQEAIALHPDQESLMVCLGNGQRLRADQVVLALGNFPPNNPPIADPSFYLSRRYIGSPWSIAALGWIPVEQPVVLVGAGLTAVDLALALQQQGHKGAIEMVSRRGLLPQSHQLDHHGYPDFLSLDFLRATEAPKTVRVLMRRLREAVQAASVKGHNWQTVIDALRPQTQTLWRSLSLEEQQRFLRHVKVYWEVHRHRMAPEVGEAIATMIATGQLTVHAGRIQAYQENAEGVDVQVQKRGSTKITTLRASAVINCTGTACQYRKFQHPLITNLLKLGLICPDSLALGLRVAANGALINPKGLVSKQLYTIGSPRRGDLWETTAAPEIREQARHLAEELLNATSLPVPQKQMEHQSFAELPV